MHASSQPNVLSTDNDVFDIPCTVQGGTAISQLSIIYCRNLVQLQVSSSAFVFAVIIHRELRNDLLFCVDALFASRGRSYTYIRARGIFNVCHTIF